MRRVTQKHTKQNKIIIHIHTPPLPHTFLIDFCVKFQKITKKKEEKKKKEKERERKTRQK